jgi:2-oxo-hept-3-ene-1,7-dioate hydratase
MLAKDQIEAAAANLDEAERSRVQTKLVSLTYPDMTMDDAYAIQAEWVRKKLASGRKVIGWKIGLTSKAMQYALNINIPDSGVLFDDMLFEDNATIPKERFIQPRVEAEIAFVMKAPLQGPGITVFDVLNATDYVTPALEILDTRILRVDPETKKARNIFDTIADNAANAGIVTGGRAVRPDQIDMRWMGAIVSRNGEVEETGLGAGVLNQPARGVAWLANRLAQYGDSIKPGQIVLAGSFIRPIEARHGDTIVADFGPYGSVSLFFA